MNSGGSSKRIMPSTLILMAYLGLSLPYAFLKTAYEEEPTIEGGGPPYGLATPLVKRWRQWYSEAQKGADSVVIVSGGR